MEIKHVVGIGNDDKIEMCPACINVDENAVDNEANLYHKRMVVFRLCGKHKHLNKMEEVIDAIERFRSES